MSALAWKPNTLGWIRCGRDFMCSMYYSLLLTLGMAKAGSGENEYS